jgi:magnesium-transporting ATPase (P-type)
LVLLQLALPLASKHVKMTHRLFQAAAIHLLPDTLVLINSYRANLLPEDKIKIIKELQGREGKVAMVGDGINDAPALVQANIGIAMGAMGTEAAMEVADIVLMQDKLEKIARARAISKRAFKTIKENIIVGVGVVHIHCKNKWSQCAFPAVRCSFERRENGNGVDRNFSE